MKAELYEKETPITVANFIKLAQSRFYDGLTFHRIIEGFMMGVGKTKQPFVFNIIGMWCVRIVGTFIFTQLLPYGLIAAWSCMIAHNMLLCVLYFITYIRGSWNPLHERTLKSA